MVVLNGTEANPLAKPGLAASPRKCLPKAPSAAHRTRSPTTGRRSARICDVSNSDDTVVAIRTLKPNVEAAFDLLSDVALHPAFEDNEIERVRKPAKATSCSPGRSHPTRDRCPAQELYGHGHPYGYRDEGTVEANRGISRDDLLKLWQAGYAPGNSALVLTGDLTAAEARQLAEKYFGGWKGTVGRADCSGARRQDDAWHFDLSTNPARRRLCCWSGIWACPVPRRTMSPSRS